jgi:hypothetical protein
LQMGSPKLLIKAGLQPQSSQSELPSRQDYWHEPLLRSCSG